MKMLEKIVSDIKCENLHRDLNMNFLYEFGWFTE